MPSSNFALWWSFLCGSTGTEDPRWISTLTTSPGAMAQPKRTSTQPLDAPNLLVGRVLDGRFRLESVLNAGGMGIIFEATQLTVGRKVAVKVLKPTLSTDPSLIERFHLEVHLVASIVHPNVVQLIDSGQDASGITYLVMEFVEGQTLRQALRKGELRLWEILYVFSQVCAALIETHGQDIIHRDLKFDNIMVSRMRDGRIHVKLLDFGVAKLLNGDKNLTQGGQVTGTPGIVAPELVDGRAPSGQSDLYSLGVLLFTALTGQAPFQAENDYALMRAHKVEVLPNLHTLVGQYVPEEVIHLTTELLEKEPYHRPKDAEAVRRRLDVMAHSLRERSPDAAPYRPPHLEGFKEPSPEFIDEEEFDFITDTELRRSGFWGVLFPRPVVAPMTVVTSLAMILMILIMILIYLIYQQAMLPTP